jgi:hypothetical protein
MRRRLDQVLDRLLVVGLLELGAEEAAALSEGDYAFGGDAVRFLASCTRRIVDASDAGATFR